MIARLQNNREWNVRCLCGSRNQTATARATEAQRMYYSTQGEKNMFAIRLALFLGLFYGFTVIAYEGTGIDPHGGGPRLTRATSDQGGGLDPDGRTRTTSNCSSCATPDAGVRIDPEG
jgi:hypothetical protein